MQGLQKFRPLPIVLLLLPLDLIVATAFAAVEIFGNFLQLLPWARGFSLVPGSNRESSRATIQVLNWDGKHLLEECLPHVLEAIRHNGGNHEILVVDNGSTDGSVEFVCKNYPGVRVLALDRNYGFGEGNNRGVQAVRTEVVVFLNNDMIVDRGFLKPLLDGFSDPSVFAVTSQVFFADPSRRREETGKTRGSFERGFLRLWHAEIAAGEEDGGQVPVFWAGGGSCAVDREMFLDIGGFDSLFSPAYVEDTDLSYQAWKRGWKCVLAPASQVIHKHRATTGRKFGNGFVDNTIRKNQYLFIWKNITDYSMTFEHLINLPRNHVRGSIQMGFRFEVRAFLRAFVQLPSALYRRLACLRHYRAGDREVFMRSQKA